jgi:hypothetical protein
MRFMHRNERECEITLYLLILWDLCQVCSVDALRNLLCVFVTRKFIFDISFDVDTVSPLTKSRVAKSPLKILLKTIQSMPEALTEGVMSLSNQS